MSVVTIPFGPRDNVWGGKSLASKRPARWAAIRERVYVLRRWRLMDDPDSKYGRMRAVAREAMRASARRA